MAKSIEFLSALFVRQASKPYSRIGKHLLYMSSSRTGTDGTVLAGD